MIKKNYKCILITTKDGKKFFTQKKNLNKLKAYEKAFRAEISVVRVKEAEILTLDELAVAIVSDKKIKNEPEYVVLSEGGLKQNKNLTANKIKSFIKNEFESGHPVSVNNILKKFKNKEVTNSCACLHLKSVREELIKAGVEIEKIKHGVYQNKIFIN